MRKYITLMLEIAVIALLSGCGSAADGESTHPARTKETKRQAS